MGEKIFDKVFLKNSVFKVTNTSLTYIKKSEWLPKWDITHTWDAKSIKNVEEVVPRNFSENRFYFWISVVIFVVYGGDIFNFGELTLLGMSAMYSATVAIMVFVAGFIIIHQKIIKPARYLSIKLKNGEETIIQTPFDSLISVENAWNSAVDFGVETNSSEELISNHSLEVTKETFSVWSVEKTLYITDRVREEAAWSSFGVENIVNIVEEKMGKTWFNEYGLATTIIGGFLASMYFRAFGAEDFLAMSLFAIILGGFLFAIKRVIELDEMELTIELKDGAKVKVPGHYNWGGVSEAKIALNTAMGKC